MQTIVHMYNLFQIGTWQFLKQTAEAWNMLSSDIAHHENLPI